MAQRTVYSIGELTAYIKALFEDDALLGDVWLQGEVSNFKLHTSGHCYLTLKDPASSIKAVIWRTTAARLTLPRDGDAVIAHGRISVYEPQGAYQLYIDHIEPAGVGRLWLEFERLKQRLEAEGLFDAERKRPIPAVPVRLGIVTSATGAALRDILQTLRARYRAVEVVLAPTLVQGDGAPASIIAALQLLNRWSQVREPLDTIILARGGGSIEELWAFNDEGVARAIVASRVPIVTGIGHETDFTIADFAADLRAPTPTGAATLASPDTRALKEALAALQSAAAARMADRLASARAGHSTLDRRLERASPEGRLAHDRQRVDDLARRAELATTHRLDALNARLSGQRLRMAALDPSGVLARGYAVVTATPTGQVIRSVTQAALGLSLRVRVADGAFGATATENGAASRPDTSRGTA